MSPRIYPEFEGQEIFVGDTIEMEHTNGSILRCPVADACGAPGVILRGDEKPEETYFLDALLRVGWKITAHHPQPLAPRAATIRSVIRWFETEPSMATSPGHAIAKAKRHFGVSS